MSSNPRDPKAADPAQQAEPGLEEDELRAEQAGELPDRDAMSIIGVGGLEGGLPPAGLLDGILDAGAPVDGLPVEQYQVDQSPTEPPVDGDAVSIPGPLDASADASVEV